MQNSTLAFLIIPGTWSNYDVISCINYHEIRIPQSRWIQLQNTVSHKIGLWPYLQLGLCQGYLHGSQFGFHGGGRGRNRIKNLLALDTSWAKNLLALARFNLHTRLKTIHVVCFAMIMKITCATDKIWTTRGWSRQIQRWHKIIHNTR